jgi:hypothetical protein
MREFGLGGGRRLSGLLANVAAKESGHADF